MWLTEAQMLSVEVIIFTLQINLMRKRVFPLRALTFAKQFILIYLFLEIEFQKISSFQNTFNCPNPLSLTKGIAV